MVTRLDKIYAAIALTSSLSIVAWMFQHFHYGINITDEGYYLVWMANPFQYDISLSQFGHVYHPFYKMLQGNIVWLRQGNLLATMALTWVLAHMTITSKTNNQESASNKIIDYVISFGFSTAALSYYTFHYITTPSYNSLTLQALLLFAIALTMTTIHPTGTSTSGWVLLGLSGGLGFHAKPSTALLMAIIALFYLLAQRQFRFRKLLIAMATSVGAVLLGALFVDGSVTKFIDRIFLTLSLYKTMGGNHTLGHLFRFDSLAFNASDYVIIFTTIASTFAATLCLSTNFVALVTGGFVLSMTFVAAIFYYLLNYAHSLPEMGSFRTLYQISIFAIPFITLIVSRRMAFIVKAMPQLLLLSMTLLVLPYCFAMGTGNNYWTMAGMAGLFWVISGVVLLSVHVQLTKKRISYYPLLFAVQLMLVMLVAANFEKPFGQPHGLNKCSYTIDVGSPGSTLMLPSSFGIYLSQLGTVASKAGFTPGTPMIDLTGQSPAVLYALQATSVGFPWLAGGYPGTDKVVGEMLRRAPCEQVAAAWLLVENKGPRSVPETVLLGVGCNLHRDYENVGSVNTPRRIDNSWESDASFITQDLMRPVRSLEDAIAACKVAQNTN